MVSTDGIRVLVQPLLASAGLRLWDVEIGADVVRVLVDRDGGVDLEALSDASRVLSGLLDSHDELVPAGEYQLEVSSPGVERTLRISEHYGQYLGATVAVKTTSALDGGRRHRGVLTSADDDGIGLLVDTAPDGPPINIPYDRIERAHPVLEWGPAPKPGSRPKAGSSKAGSSKTTAGRPGRSASRAEGNVAAGPAQDTKDRSA
jgi:ribosome maturation factor RimP